MKKEEIKYLILNITNKTDDLEEKADLVLNLYYNRRIYFQPYTNSRNRLIQLILEERFPSPQEWNKIAYQEGLFSSITMKYIENCDWKGIEKKFRKELKDLLLGKG